MSETTSTPTSSETPPTTPAAPAAPVVETRDEQLEALVRDSHQLGSIVAQKQRELDSYTRQLTIVKQRILSRNAVLKAAAEKARKK